MYYITPERDLARMDIKSLKNLKAEVEHDIDMSDCGLDMGGAGHCKDHAKLNFYLERINKWIVVRKAGEELAEIRKEKRESMDEYYENNCAYDEILYADNIY